MINLLIWAFAGTLIFLISLLIKNFALKKQLNHANIEVKADKEAIATLESKVKELSIYSTIADVEAHIREKQNESDKAFAEAKQQAESIVTEAKQKKESILKDVNTELWNKRKEAEKVIKEANESSQSIIEMAKEEAKKIAGKAYEALQKTEDLEKTAKAMKNIIEGYGDQYIIPTHNLIDQLADEFSHKDAGEELKKARETTRKMIKGETAALCDYVEEYRKRTAIEFVLDAFNGKVDSILASAKKDNYGTLLQKVQDAFQTVNHNGQAFRNARILETFLANRLLELKWTCSVIALKEQEKEEQRRIKEQIREEEKAAKEYEKAIKEAAKEEESITKAMDKIRQEIQSSTATQRLEYETKLKELEEKLKVAEEKNLRAISMAQQTKTGHVYIISNIGSFGEDILKIGMTRRLEPEDRVRELGDASVPFAFDIHAMILSEDAPALEKELHRAFVDAQVNKINPRKEFFNVRISEIKEKLEKMGIKVRWTLTAEAREYRESQAIGTSQAA